MGESCFPLVIWRCVWLNHLVVLRLHHIVDSTLTLIITFTLSRRITDIIHVPIITFRILHFINTDVTETMELSRPPRFLRLIGFIVLWLVTISVLEVFYRFVHFFANSEWFVILLIIDFSKFIFTTNSRLGILNDTTSFGILVHSNRHLWQVLIRPICLWWCLPFHMDRGQA